MALTEVDRDLIENCLERVPSAWFRFADRFGSLFYHVVLHTADCRSFTLNPVDTDDIVAEIFQQILAHDFQVLRRFRGKSSLATYLTVIARRVAVHSLIAIKKKRNQNQPIESAAEPTAPDSDFDRENRDLIEYLLRQLPAPEARIVRAYYLSGKTYQQISQELKISENSIGSVLSRAKDRLRRLNVGVSD